MNVFVPFPHFFIFGRDGTKTKPNLRLAFRGKTWEKTVYYGVKNEPQSLGFQFISQI
jgi:hypothetical protein